MPSSRQSDSSLFSSQKPGAPESYIIAHIDGGARGNPGPAGYGVFITDQTGHKVAELSHPLGNTTNNVAEYNGLLAALRYAIEHNKKALKVVSDSELLVRQMKGIYKVKNQDLRRLYDQAQQLVAQLEWFQIQHVLREQNRDADRLANEAMDKGSGRVRTTEARGPSPAGSALVNQEFEGVVRDGAIQLVNGDLPEGTRVQVRVKAPRS
jgi:ribonuclease HI